MCFLAPSKQPWKCQKIIYCIIAGFGFGGLWAKHEMGTRRRYTCFPRASFLILSFLGVSFTDGLADI